MAQIPKPELRTERLILRQARPSDVADRLALGNSPEIQKMFGMDPAQVRPITQAAAEAWVAAQINETWGWVLDHAGGCIGSIRIHSLNWADKRASLALGILDEGALGRGLGTEAMEAVARFAFGQLDLHRLSVRALAFNTRAIAAYEKIGFVQEGLERDAALIGTDWHDDVLLGLIAPDFARPRVSERSVRTPRITLRPFVAADVPRVVEILNDLEVSRWLVPVAHPFTRADCIVVDRDGSSRWPRHMAVIHEGRIIGGIGTEPQLGFYLAPGAKGQGLMTEAVRAALAHVFTVQGRRDIASGHFADNHASRRVLEKLGFRETGRTCRTSTATRIEHPCVEAALTKEEWDLSCSLS